MLLALQTEPKWVKIDGSERSSSKGAPGRFRRPYGTPNYQKKKNMFGSRFGTKARPKNEVCPERPFGRHSAPNGLRNGANIWKTVLPPRRELTFSLSGGVQKEPCFGVSLRTPLETPLGRRFREFLAPRGPQKGPKRGSKMRPSFWDHFWSGSGGRGDPTRESKASQNKDLKDPLFPDH